MTEPKSFTAELKAELLERVATGESVSSIMSAAHMPSRRTLFNELQRDEAFARAYSIAREVALEVWEDELQRIADTPETSVTRITRPDGSVELREADDVQARRLQITTRQWLMSKRLPKKYGDRVAQEVSGPEGKPVAVEATSDLDVARRIAFVFERALRRQKP